ncbi:MAG: hypothetical protein NVSMB65_08940 [Chloroflexota bacterium]
MWALLGGLLVAVLLAATLLVARPGAPAAACGGAGTVTGVTAGQCAPDFTLNDLRGRRVSLSRLRGSPVLVHFWAVGCTTCAGEYHDFSRIVAQSVPGGLAVLAVDAWGEPASMMQQWQNTHHLPATLLVDPHIAVFQAYGGQGTPTTFFIDRRGRVVASSRGPLSFDGYRSALARLL